MDRDLNIYNELKAAAEELAVVETHTNYFKSGSVIVIDTDKLSNYGVSLLGWILKQETEND